MNEQNIQIHASRVLVPGLTFKENCVIYDLKHVFTNAPVDARL